jgi:hypothetical protein
MSIIGLIITLVVIGLLMWLVNSYIPMADPYKKILNVVVIVLVVLWLLGVFGVFNMHLGNVPQIR